MENEYQSSSIHSQVQWVEIFSERVFLERTCKETVAGTSVYKPNLGLPSPDSVPEIFDLVYSSKRPTSLSTKSVLILLTKPSLEISIWKHSTALHRGAFCQFPFLWIYYFHIKSTVKETGKTCTNCHWIVTRNLWLLFLLPSFSCSQFVLKKSSDEILSSKNHHWSEIW